MAEGVSGLAIAGIITAVAGTAVSVTESRKARAAQERANRARNNLSQLENRRQAVEQLRRQRAARADIVAAGEAQGAAGSSSVVGGAGAVGSQAAANLSFLQSAQETGAFISQQNVFTGIANDKANTAAAAGQLGFNLGTNPSFTSIFSGEGGVSGLSQAQADWKARTGN